jgi:hypothetical protein
VDRAPELGCAVEMADPLNADVPAACDELLGRLIAFCSVRPVETTWEVVVQRVENERVLTTRVIFTGDDAEAEAMHYARAKRMERS